MSADSMRAVLDEAAAGLDGLEARAAAAGGAPAGAAADSVEWVLDGVVVAVLSPGAAEFRLRREVAAAALRTPNVKASPRGAGWVRFAPASIDGHASDRAKAWLESAWRYADAMSAGEE